MRYVNNGLSGLNGFVGGVIIGLNRGYVEGVSKLSYSKKITKP